MQMKKKIMSSVLALALVCGSTAYLPSSFNQTEIQASAASNLSGGSAGSVSPGDMLSGVVKVGKVNNVMTYSKMKNSDYDTPFWKMIISSNKSNTLDIHWDDVNGATGYKVYRYNTSTKKWDAIANVTKRSSTKCGGWFYSDKNLKWGTLYKYKVKAYKKYTVTQKNGKKVTNTYYGTASDVVVGLTSMKVSPKYTYDSKTKTHIITIEKQNFDSSINSYKVLLSTSGTGSSYNTSITVPKKNVTYSGKNVIIKIKNASVSKSIRNEKIKQIIVLPTAPTSNLQWSTCHGYKVKEAMSFGNHWAAK